MTNFSTKVGDNNKGPVAGGIGSKAVHNQKDNSGIWKLLIIAVTVVIVISVLAYTKQLDIPFVNNIITVFVGMLK